MQSVCGHITSEISRLCISEVYFKSYKRFIKESITMAHSTAFTNCNSNLAGISDYGHSVDKEP